MRILIVEDEKRLAQALGQILKEQGYCVDLVHTGPDGLDYARSGIYDAMVLDVMLPGKNGFVVADELRKEKNAIPILMLTAKDTIPDKVTGLDSGADDYMTKPFAPEELLARVRALCRRQGEVIGEALSFGDLVFHSASSLLCSGAKEVRLNHKEAQIMTLLLLRPGMLLSKEEIITKVWGYDSDAGDSNVEAYMSFLRKKLAFLGSSVAITALKKQGYQVEMKTW